MDFGAGENNSFGGDAGANGNGCHNCGQGGLLFLSIGLR